MEPRQQWRGNSAVLVGEFPFCCQLQWSRANNGAETYKKIRTQEVYLLLQWSRANNGAETLYLYHLRPSMLKLQWSRANNGAETPVKGPPQRCPRPCFNGAAPTMARKRVPRCIFVCLVSSFNGAAPTMARKHSLYFGACECCAWLQWSRANNGAETRVGGR